MEPSAAVQVPPLEKMDCGDSPAKPCHGQVSTIQRGKKLVLKVVMSWVGGGYIGEKFGIFVWKAVYALLAFGLYTLYTYIHAYMTQSRVGLGVINRYPLKPLSPHNLDTPNIWCSALHVSLLSLPAAPPHIKSGHGQ